MLFTMRRKKTLLLIAAFSSLNSSCERERQSGSILVNSTLEGKYEIFKYDPSGKVPAVSEGLSNFNTPTSIKPGAYLLLADCSSKVIRVYPNETTTLKAFNLKFVPPIEPSADDQFNVKCRRHHSIRSLQSFKNQFNFQLLSHSSNMLVGLKPYTVEFKEGGPTEVSVNLTSVRVIGNEQVQGRTSYFISNNSRLAAVKHARANLVNTNTYCQAHTNSS